MKKSLVFATALTALLCGCSNDATEMGVSGVQESTNGLQPISLGLSVFDVSVQETKGTGTVGDLADSEKNVWNNEDVHVLMTNIPEGEQAWGYTVTNPTLGFPFKNEICKPVKVGTEWQLQYDRSNGLKYYPMNGASDFFAFHSDDAVTDYSTLDQPTASNTLEVNFEIDGSQDLLAGKSEDLDANTRKGYTAATSRAGIVPNIPMDHLLTRFTFELRSGHDDAEGMEVTDISLASQAVGTWTVAYNQLGTKEPIDLLAWDATVKNLSLKERVGDILDGSGNKTELQPLTAQVLGKKGESKSINGALFVKPNETEYVMNVTVRRPYQKNENGDIDYTTETFQKLLTLDGGEKAMEIGKTYNVQITLYGMKDITVTTTLNGWISGGDILVDTEK